MKATTAAALILGLLVGAAVTAGGGYLAYSGGYLDAWQPQVNQPRKEAHEGHDHAEPAEHPEHEGHDRQRVHVSGAVMEEFDIRLATAGPGRLRVTRNLSGEVVLNGDRVAHIVPRLEGIVRAVHKTFGDPVDKGEVMALLECRELAQAKAEYLAAQQRITVVEANVRANEALRAKGVIPDLDFLAAQRDLAEAKIALRAADLKLHTFGMTHEQLAGIPEQDEEALLLYELRAPFSGTVADKHIAIGELVNTESDVFLLADLSTVWVNLTVYSKDLAYVRTGQPVQIQAAGVGQASGTLEYVSPIVAEATRTAVARVTIANPDRVWRPGLFVTGQVVVEEVEAPLLVPRSAIQQLDGDTVVFVQTETGFEPRSVRLGREDVQSAEIVAGLEAGDQYVSVGGFSLKAELGKESFAGHGHAH